MLLIADSGSTGTDWCLIGHDQTVEIRTRGINPFMEESNDIALMIKQELIPQLPLPPTAIYFYGAGCIHKGKETVQAALADAFRNIQTEVESDLLAAARALCHHSPGIACIMGTGSNSCYYNGHDIVNNISPLGFILGDEGSGAVLGKRFMGSLLKNQFSADIKQSFMNEYQLTPADIIEKVYRQPYPNRFLASFVPFILKNIECPEIRAMVLDEFESFITRNILQYPQAWHLPIHFTGSIAWYFSDILEEALVKHQLKRGTITASPMQELIGYHQKNEI